MTLVKLSEAKPSQYTAMNKNVINQSNNHVPVEVKAVLAELMGNFNLQMWIPLR